MSKTRTSWSALLLFVILGLTSSAVAEQAVAKAPALPSAREIIDRHIKALGGRDALTKFSSHHVRGKVELPSQGMTGEVEIFAARPNRIKVITSLPGVGQSMEGYDGTTAWQIHPAMGPRLLEGKELDQSRRLADFYSELHDPAMYRSMETVGIVPFEGRDCYKLRLVTAFGVEVFEFYDRATRLFAGTIYAAETPMGSMNTTNVVTEYKQTSGVLVPVKTIQRMMGLEVIVTLTSFENDNVPDSAFALPPEIKALAGK